MSNHVLKSSPSNAENRWHNVPDVPVPELIEALNDAEKSEAMMRKYGWTREQLLARAEFVAKALAAGIANVNCV
jgi:hypothetical protein